LKLPQDGSVLRIRWGEDRNRNNFVDCHKQNDLYKLKTIRPEETVTIKYFTDPKIKTDHRNIYRAFELMPEIFYLDYQLPGKDPVKVSKFRSLNKVLMNKKHFCFLTKGVLNRIYHYPEDANPKNPLDL